jgi:hypothetical protein
MKTKLLGVIFLLLFAFGMSCRAGQADVINIGDAVSGSLYINAAAPVYATGLPGNAYYTGNLGAFSTNLGGAAISMPVQWVSADGYAGSWEAENIPNVAPQYFDLLLVTMAATSLIVPLQITPDTIASFTQARLNIQLYDTADTGTIYRITLSSLLQVDSLADFTFSGTISAVDPFSSAVPEPSTWALLLIGFAGIGFAAKRQRRVSFI